MFNIAFIFHGKIRKWNHIFSQLKQSFNADHKLASFITKSAMHSIELAEQAVMEGFTHIISIGGDGTLNEVANGLMNAKKQMSEEDWHRIRLGVLPMGTGNDFIKTVNAPKDIEGIQKLVLTDSFKNIDLGLVKYQATDGGTLSRYFINIADVGIGGVVVEKLNRYSRWLGPRLTYQRAILSTFLRYKGSTVKAIADDFTYEGRIKGLVVAKGKYFGSGLGIAPDAAPDNGQFAVVVLGEISMLDYLKNLRDVSRCKKIIHPGVHYKTAKKVLIESSEEPMPLDIDGEFVGYTPLNISIAPSAIKFLC
jgi:diacylglycerol kinase (ATP)